MRVFCFRRSPCRCLLSALLLAALLGASQAHAQAPAWTVDAAAFSRTMSVTGALDVPVEPGDRLAAFVGGEVRGVAEPQVVAGAWRFFVTVHSRAAAETIAFRFYDASEGAVVALDGTLAFAAGTIAGSAAAPRTWRVLPCSDGIAVEARTLLEGFFDGTGVRTALSAVLPETDPYGTGVGVAPGFFASAAGRTVADWVLLELREGDAAAPPMAVVARAAALLLADGRLVGLDGQGPVVFGVPTGAYHLVVRHRNHVPVMSAVPVDCRSGACTYDFTTRRAQAFGEAQADLSGSGPTPGTGPFALFAGDADGDGDVDTDDFLVWSRAFGQTSRVPPPRPASLP